MKPTMSREELYEEGIKISKLLKHGMTLNQFFKREKWRKAALISKYNLSADDLEFLRIVIGRAIYLIV